MESEREENKEENRALETEKEERVEEMGEAGAVFERDYMRPEKTSCPVPWARP